VSNVRKFWPEPIAPASMKSCSPCYYGIGNNHAQYPGIHDYFRTHRPAILAVSGANDPIFPANQCAHLRDLPRQSRISSNTGHFTLEDKGDEIAALMHDFLNRTVGSD